MPDATSLAVRERRLTDALELGVSLAARFVGELVGLPLPTKRVIDRRRA
jgi:hypothetical protein